jgi:hypothetical protein
VRRTARAQARPARGGRTHLPRPALGAYLAESRDIGLSLLLVLPLLLAYEIAVLLLAPPARNAAELAVADLAGRLPPEIAAWLRRGLLLLLLALAYALSRHEQPRVARARWILLEALAFALLLGPLLRLLLGGLGLSLGAGTAAAGQPAWLPFLLSTGAGLWEELVFRLGLLGGLALLLARVARLPAWAATGLAVAVSALAFALYHHVGAHGEPLQAARFAYRALAGTILGLLFVTRGLAVVVYMHVFYDVLCDLRALDG